MARARSLGRPPGSRRSARFSLRAPGTAAAPPGDARGVLEHAPRHGRARLARAGSEVRGQDDVLEAEVCLGHARLVREDVEARTADPPLRERLGEGRVVEHAAPCGVHDNRVRLEERDTLAREQVASRRDERDVQGDEVALGEERFERDALRPRHSGLARARVKDPHVEAACAPRERLADPAEPDDAHRLAGHLRPEHPGRVDLCPPAGADNPVAPRRRGARRRGGAPSRGRRSRR